MISPAVMAPQRPFFSAWPAGPLGNASKAMMLPFSTGGAGAAAQMVDVDGVAVPSRFQFVSDDPPPGQSRSLRMECQQFDIEYVVNSYIHKERVQASAWAAPQARLRGNLGAFEKDWWFAIWRRVDSPFSTPRNPDTAITGVGGVAATNRVTKTAHGFENGEVIGFTSDMTGTGLTQNVSYFVVNKTADDFQVCRASTTAGEFPPWNRGGVIMDITADFSGKTFVSGPAWRILWQNFDSHADTHKQSIALNEQMFDAGKGWALEYQNAGSANTAYSGSPVEPDAWYKFLMHVKFDDGTAGDGINEIWAAKAGERFPTTPQAYGTGANLDSPMSTNIIDPVLCLYRATTPETQVTRCAAARIANTRAQAESLFPV